MKMKKRREGGGGAKIISILNTWHVLGMEKLTLDILTLHMFYVTK
jgi:hypothetical protein